MACYNTTIVNTFPDHIESTEHQDQAAFVGVFATKEAASKTAEEIGVKTRKRTVTVDGIKISLFFAVQDQS
tara:strand:- start:2057 stop:2269 length:213 start_codon:yes stop_codon:yes gene_type:complete